MKDFIGRTVAEKDLVVWKLKVPALIVGFGMIGNDEFAKIVYFPTDKDEEPIEGIAFESEMVLCVKSETSTP